MKHLLGEMARRGIRTHLGHKLQRFEADKVVTEGGEFAADLILFMPGMTGNAWFDATDLPRSPGGLLQADAHCRMPGCERVYVVGDSGSFPGPDWMPKQAHMADLQAAAAADNLLGDLKGAPANATFKVELICIVDAIDHGTLVYRTPRAMCRCRDRSCPLGQARLRMEILAAISMSEPTPPPFADPAGTWNRRFGEGGYLFGTAPNAWLRRPRGNVAVRPARAVRGRRGRPQQRLAGAPGPAVDAFDVSDVGVAKARRLAATQA